MLAISSNKQQMACAQYSLAPPPQVSIKRNNLILQNDPQDDTSPLQNSEADHPPNEAEMTTTNEENEENTNKQQSNNVKQRARKYTLFPDRTLKISCH